NVDAKSYNLNPHYINFTSEDKLLSNVGFDYAYWLQNSYADELDSPLGKITIDSKSDQKLSVKIGENDSLRFDILAFEQKLLKEFANSDTSAGKKGASNTPKVDENNSVIIPAELMTLSSTSQQYKVEIRIQSISVRRSSESNERYQPSFT